MCTITNFTLVRRRRRRRRAQCAILQRDFTEIHFASHIQSSRRIQYYIYITWCWWAWEWVVGGGWFKGQNSGDRTWLSERLCVTCARTIWARCGVDMREKVWIYVCVQCTRCVSIESETVSHDTHNCISTYTDASIKHLLHIHTTLGAHIRHASTSQGGLVRCVRNSARGNPHRGVRIFFLARHDCTATQQRVWSACI